MESRRSCAYPLDSSRVSLRCPFYGEDILKLGGEGFESTYELLAGIW
jgi:hypothetical protein